MIKHDDSLPVKEQNLLNLEKEKNESKAEVKGESVVKTELKDKSSTKVKVESESKMKSKASTDVSAILPIEVQ